MRPRLLKEARGLLPAWLMALCLVLAPQTAWRLLPPHQYFLADAFKSLVYFGLALGPLMLSSIAFGREFDEGTFGFLLSQPVSRWRLWWENTGMVALALVTFCCAVLLATGASVLPLPVFAGIILSAYGGGLLCSLLVRQTLGAVCLGALVPFLLSVVLSILAAVRRTVPQPAATTARPWFRALVAWAVAAYVAALLLFLTREDAVPSRALAVFGFRLRGATHPAGRVSPWRALVWKELHLQQWSIYLGLALPLVTLIAVALAPFEAQSGARVASRFAGLAVVGVVVLTATVPALIGLTTVAEERRTGARRPGTSVSQSSAGLLAACIIGSVSRTLGTAPPARVSDPLTRVVTSLDHHLGNLGQIWVKGTNRPATLRNVVQQRRGPLFIGDFGTWAGFR